MTTQAERDLAKKVASFLADTAGAVPSLDSEQYAALGRAYTEAVAAQEHALALAQDGDCPFCRLEWDDKGQVSFHDASFCPLASVT